MTVPGAGSVIEKVVAVLALKSSLDARDRSRTPRLLAFVFLLARNFIVSPHSTADIECCRRYGIRGTARRIDATEVVTAWSAGADIVKVFPAGSVGGRQLH